MFLVHRFSDFKTFSYSAVTEVCRTLLKDKRVVVALSAIAVVGAVFCALQLRRSKPKFSAKPAYPISVSPKHEDTRVTRTVTSDASTVLEPDIPDREVDFIISALCQEILFSKPSAFTIEEQESEPGLPSSLLHAAATKALRIRYEFDSNRKTCSLEHLLSQINWSALGSSLKLDTRAYDRFNAFVRQSVLQVVTTHKKPFVLAYSGSMYRSMNTLLRWGRLMTCDHSPPSLRAQHINLCAKGIFFACIGLAAELATVPYKNEKKILMRKANFDPAYIGRHFVSGQIYIEPGFCSTTANSGAQNSPLFMVGGNTLFKIHASSGRSIRDYVMTFAQWENEWLFLPGTRFKVLSCRLGGKEDTTTSYTVELQECS